VIFSANSIIFILTPVASEFALMLNWSSFQF